MPTTVPFTKLPTLVKEDAVTPELSVAPVKVPAAAVTVIFPVPSKLTPLMVLGVWSAVAVVAFPERAPENVVADKTPVLGLTDMPVLVLRGWFPVAVFVNTK